MSTDDHTWSRPPIQGTPADIQAEVQRLADRMNRTFTHPDVLRAAEAGEPWAEPETDPRQIDWKTRQARAAIPFRLVDGRPVRPGPPTGIRYGRNQLGHWGEQLAADALVTVTDQDGHRWVLLVRRADGHGWAMPGGYVDPGETATHAAARELAEETGLTLPADALTADAPRLMDDPRGSDESWIVSVVCRTHLGTMHTADFPSVRGLDDAADAAWIMADTYATLCAELADLGGRVFPAHVPTLRDAL